MNLNINILVVIGIIYIFLLIFIICIISKENHKYDDIKISTLEELNQWVYINIIYKRNGVEDIYDHWQYPEETLEIKTGDCEDKAILFSDIAKNKLNIDVYLVKVVTIEPIASHWVILYGRTIYDPTCNRIMNTVDYFQKVILYEVCSREEILKRIEDHRSK